MSEQRSVRRADELEADRFGRDRFSSGVDDPGSGSPSTRLWVPLVALAVLVLLPGGLLWWGVSVSAAVIGGLAGWVAVIVVILAIMPAATLVLAAVGWRGDYDVSRWCGVALIVLAGLVIGAPLAGVVACDMVGSRGSGVNAVDTRQWVIEAGGFVHLVWTVPLGLLAAAAIALLGSLGAGRSRMAVVAMAWGATLIGTVGFLALYAVWTLGTSLSSHTRMSDEVSLVWGLPVLAVPLGIAAAVVGGGVISDD